MNLEKIGSFIQLKRKEKKLTQKELAEKLKITDKKLSSYEKGKDLPDIMLIQKICKELDISIIEFLRGKKGKISEEDEKLIIESINIYDQGRKKKIIENVNKFLILTFTFTICLLLFNNVKNSFMINRRYYNDVEIERDYKDYSKKIELIKNNKGNYTDQEYDLINEYMSYININKAEEIFNLSNQKMFYLNETTNIMEKINFSLLFTRDRKAIEILKFIVEKDIEKIDVLLQYDKISNIILNEIVSLSQNNAKQYSYEFRVGTNVAYLLPSIVNFDNAITNKLLDIIIEVGEINE